MKRDDHKEIAFDCSSCDHQIETNTDRLRRSKYQLRCPLCYALFRVDVDFEFVDGMWRDLTTLTRLYPKC